MPIQLGGRWLHNIVFYDVILKADPFKPSNAFLLGWAFVMYKITVRGSSLPALRDSRPSRTSRFGSVSHIPAHPGRIMPSPVADSKWRIEGFDGNAGRARGWRERRGQYSCHAMRQPFIEQPDG